METKTSWSDLSEHGGVRRAVCSSDHLSGSYKKRPTIKQSLSYCHILKGIVGFCSLNADVQQIFYCIHHGNIVWHFWFLVINRKKRKKMTVSPDDGIKWNIKAALNWQEWLLKGIWIFATTENRSCWKLPKWSNYCIYFFVWNYCLLHSTSTSINIKWLMCKSGAVQRGFHRAAFNNSRVWQQPLRS